MRMITDDDVKIHFILRLLDRAANHAHFMPVITRARSSSG